ncbi:MAG: 1-deoxy-D-xylulose-5-phosphate synthase [Firmicutes bacterium]|nr:1-deoxy-D-xylulose-5-phosphate synthase [Bacillota bacterium]
MLENIKSPQDLKSLSYDELDTLAAEIRDVIINTVKKNGGHLASNLGIVEATIALHRVFSYPEDKIIFDVSHQAYPHKLLTGRYESFDTLRQFGGISGFTDKNESPYDTVTAGHSGSSVSVALGIAEANHALGSDGFAVAVVGDGSFTNGMIYEAINNCADSKDRNLLIVLNDNEMSISKNVGGLARYLTKVRTSSGYISFKHRFDKKLSRIPVIGVPTAKFLKWIKDSLKGAVIKDTLFENLGVPYIGTVDGNDIERLEKAFSEAKKYKGVSIVHIITKKGLGLESAENHPESFHSVSPECNKGCHTTSYTSVFGDFMMEAAKRDDKIFAITSAMTEGVGLLKYSKAYPDRFRDVGIAEEHSVAFSGGLSLSGLNPVCAIYSTFSQRTFDQVFHDVALQGAHVTLALDHCGIVSGDGYTHQGVYDVSLFSSIPNVTIYSPETFEEEHASLERSVSGVGVNIVRYSKGGELEYDRSKYTGGDDAKYIIPDAPLDAVIFTYGLISAEADAVYRALSRKNKIGIVKLIKIHPLDRDKILSFVGGAPIVFVIEEGMKAGGIGEKIASLISEAGTGTRVVTFAIEDEFIPHGDRSSLLKLLGLDSETVIARAEKILASECEGTRDKIKVGC